MKEKRFTILFIFLFALVVSRMSMKKQEPIKESSEMIYEKCPTNIIEPSKDSVGCIVLSKWN